MEFAAIRDCQLAGSNTDLRLVHGHSQPTSGVFVRAAGGRQEIRAFLRWARGLDHIVFADNNIASAPARTGDAKTQPIPAAPRVSAPALARRRSPPADSTPSSDWANGMPPPWAEDSPDGA
jgi:hypothetical protein